MAGTLTALTFATDGADAVFGAIKDLSTRNLIKLQYAAVVRWPAGARRPRTSQVHDIKTRHGAHRRVLGIADGGALRSASAWCGCRVRARRGGSATPPSRR